MTRRVHIRAAAIMAAAALVAASCGGSDAAPNTTSNAPAPTSVTTAPAATTAPGADTTAPATTAAETGGTDTTAPAADEGFAALAPAEGEPMLIGMVNTEGTPGLDFPELRTDTDLAVDYLNAHGGMGGRPVELVHCAAAGSPETSQACAQELSGKGVEMALLGLDLFPGYDTFAAAGIPVVGALPILSGDYTANALFVTGGNATTMAAMVALAVQHFDAKTVGIISADNPGANGSEQALTAALDKAGLTYVSVKGGDNETDAGFQGLMREANQDEPDVLVSLYADAGCIGAMRARVSLGIDTPVITTPICASSEVIDVVGDDAVGWNFVAIGTPGDTPSGNDFAAIIEPGHGTAATASIGLGALGISLLMTLARVANDVAADGGDVTGPAIYGALATATDVRVFPNDTLLACGLSTTYPSICSFEFPIGEFVAGGTIRTIPGFESISVVDYLP
jgi:ABC-type branched-subunit amino acid transport system substrate-binding protein